MEATTFAAAVAFPSSSCPILFFPSSITKPFRLSFAFSLTTYPLTNIRHPKLNRALGAASEGIEGLFSEEEAEIEEEEEEEENEESSIDLLFRFLHNVFRNMSKQAKKATRSVLPPAFSMQLVSFAVDGVLLLTILSSAKALLEVVCTLGGTVFAVILLLRLIWATVLHFQTGGNMFNPMGSYDTTQPAA